VNRQQVDRPLVESVRQPHACCDGVDIFRRSPRSTFPREARVVVNVRMLQRLLSSCASLLAASLALAGCAGGSSFETRRPDGDEVVDLTVVTLHKDAAPTVVEYTITRAQQRGEQPDFSFPDAAPAPTACTGSTMQLFDEPGFAGNELCLINDGDVELTTLWRHIHAGKLSYFETWAYATQSYRSGPYAGAFNGDAGTESFQSGASVAIAGVGAQQSTSLYFHQP
jgi:hypothetical protein